jgi:hypothetical protein
VVVPCIHIMYFDHIHPPPRYLLLFLISPLLLKKFFMSFIILCSYMPIIYCDYIHIYTLSFSIIVFYIFIKYKLYQSHFINIRIKILPRHPLILIILATWETEIWRIMVKRPSQANSLQDPISKITKTKWTGGVAQSVECLLCKCRALTSNSSPTRKKKKNKNLKHLWGLIELHVLTPANLIISKSLFIYNIFIF